MDVIYIILPIALLIGLGFLVAFLWALKSGQYDDTTTPAHRVLFDDDSSEKKRN